MTKEWVQGESGPQCFCGWPTNVVMCDGLPNLMCFGHSKSEGAMFALPRARTEKWPNLTNAEMKVLVEQGMKEHGLED